jgi:hypothetical protein
MNHTVSWGVVGPALTIRKGANDASDQHHETGVAARGLRPLLREQHHHASYRIAMRTRQQVVRAMVPGTNGPSFRIAEAGARRDAQVATGVDRSELNGCDGGTERTSRTSEASGERWAVDSDSAFPATVAIMERSMSVFDVVVAAILSLGPKLPGETIDRYAADITAAVDNECAHDDAFCVELALALVVVQHEESAWRESVETCRITGDGGLAISSFQLHRYWWGPYSRRELCASNGAAAERAAHTLRVLVVTTGSFVGALRAYVGCRATDPRAMRRGANFRKLHQLPAVRAMQQFIREAA